MNRATIILAVIGFVFTIAMSAVGYFVNRLDKRLDVHDARDDERFRDFSARLNQMQEDSIDRRHALRNEMHVMANESYNRLRDDMNAMEQRLKSNK